MSNYQFVAVGEAGMDTFLMLNHEQADVLCRRNPSTCELSLPYGEKVPVEQQTTCMGGNAANAAVAAARFGLSSALVAVRGDDLAGEQIAHLLDVEQVATGYLAVSEHSATPSSTVICYEGERTILSYHPPRNATSVTIPDSDWVYFTSLKADSEVLVQALQAKLRENASAHLAFQPGSYHIKQGIDALRWVVERARLLVMNLEEACVFMGLPHGTPVLSLLEHLGTYTSATVVITNGGKGAVAKQGGEYLFQPVLTEAPRVEVTGAGDSYASTMAIAFALGESLETALTWAQINASSVIGEVGAQAGLLSKDEVLSRVAQYPQIAPTPVTETLSW